MEIYFRKYSSPMGELLLVVSDAEVLMYDARFLRSFLGFNHVS